MVIDESGGRDGLRDVGLLESAVMRPQATYSGEDLYPTMLEKASALLHSLLMNHMFIDGNKRTAMFSCMTFLELNHYKFNPTNSDVVVFALKIENEKLSIEEITEWLSLNTTQT